MRVTSFFVDAETPGGTVGPDRTRAPSLGRPQTPAGVGGPSPVYPQHSWEMSDPEGVRFRRARLRLRPK